MKKLTIYSLASFGVLGAVVAASFYNHKQFYPSMVALSQSRLFNVLVSNTFMVCVALMFEVIRCIFLGNLRDQEVEKVRESTAIFLMEIFLTLTVFGERYTIKIVGLFVLCVMWKIFHWLAQSRLEFIEQTPALGSGELRLSTFLFLLIIVDSAAGKTLVNDMMTNGPSVKLLLLEEFLVMVVLAATSLLRLVVHLIDVRRNRRWEGKGAARFYLEILSDLLRMVICVVFFIAITSYYRMPINLLRDMFVAARNLYRTLRNFFNYRRLAVHLDTKFPDATPEQIQQDPTCSICFDEMSIGEAKRLHCGHMFHRHCLRQWLERQTTCPYCRQTIDTSPPPDVRANAAEAAAARANEENTNNANADNNAGQAPVNEAAAAVADDEFQAAFRLYERTYNDQRSFRESDVAAPAASSAPTSAPAASSASAPVPASSPSVSSPSTDTAPAPATTTSVPARSSAVRHVLTATTAPSLNQIQRHMPSIAEIEAYRDFHGELYKAYATLHKRITEMNADASSGTA